MKKQLYLLPFLLAVALGCSVFDRVREETRNIGDPRRSVAVPQGFDTVPSDAGLFRDDALLVRLPNESEVFFGGETTPVARDALAGRLGESFGRLAPGAEKSLTVAAAGDVRFAALLDFFRLAEKQKFEKFRLVVKPTAPSEFDYALTVSAPGELTADFFPAMGGRSRSGEMLKPNPFVLLVRHGADGRIRLNADNLEQRELITRLSEIFRRREQEGIFRLGTNETEKTVFVEAAPELKYAAVAKVIDGLRQAGSDRIVVLTEPILGLPAEKEPFISRR